MIELKNICKIYSANGNTAIGIQDVSLNFDLGEFVAITGESGSGKSTLLNVISGIDSFEEGEMLIDGKDVTDMTHDEFSVFRNNYISFIFQDYNIIDSYSVLENVMLPLLAKGYVDKEAKEKAIKAISEVGLLNRINAKGTKLSGGEKQRTVIARALVSNSPVIACDEPTGNLDSKTGKEIIDLLAKIKDNHLILFVTHDYEAVKDICSRHIVMKDGRVFKDEETGSRSKNEGVNIEIKKGNSFLKALNLAWKDIIHTPKKTILSFLVLLVASLFVTSSVMNIYSVNSALLSPDSQTTYSYNAESSLFLNAKNNSGTYDDLTSYIDPTKDYVDKNNILYNRKSDLVLNIDNKNEKELSGSFNFFGPINDELTLVEGKKPEAQDEFAFIFSSSLYENTIKNNYPFESSTADSYQIFLNEKYSEDSLFSCELKPTGYYVSDEVYSGVECFGSSIKATAELDQKLVTIQNSRLDSFFDYGTSGGGDSIIITDRGSILSFLNADSDSFTDYNSIYVPESIKGLGFTYYIYNVAFPASDLNVIYSSNITETNPGFAISRIYLQKLLDSKSVFNTVYMHNESFLNALAKKLQTKGYIVSDSRISLPSAKIFSSTISTIYAIIAIFAFIAIGIGVFILFVIINLIMQAIYKAKEKDYSVFEILGYSYHEVNLVHMLEFVILCLSSGVIAYLIRITAEETLANVSGQSMAVRTVLLGDVKNMVTPVAIIFSLIMFIVMALYMHWRYIAKRSKNSVAVNLRAGDLL